MLQSNCAEGGGAGVLHLLGEVPSAPKGKGMRPQHTPSLLVHGLHRIGRPCEHWVHKKGDLSPAAPPRPPHPCSSHLLGPCGSRTARSMGLCAGRWAAACAA